MEVTIVLLQFIPHVMRGRHDKILEDNKQHRMVAFLFDLAFRIF